MELLIAILLGTLFLGSVLLNDSRRVIPIRELRRRGRGRQDKTASKIYKLRSFGPSLVLLLWLIGSLSLGGLFLVISLQQPWLLVPASLVAGLVIWRSNSNIWPTWRWRLAGFLAPPVSSLLSLLQPILGPIGNWLDKRRIFASHTHIYEREDLLNLLHKQKGQPDNRLSEAELKIVRGALTFGDKTVDSAMTPRRMVKMVAAGASIGPLLMDELHASGFSRFPVVKEMTKSAAPEIIGILYIKDLIGHTDKGSVRSVMKKDASFINETQSLREALSAFLHTGHQLLVVVNNFEEIVGVITIEDVLEQILGEKIVDEFDHHDDLRAVAAVEAHQEHDKHSESEVLK